MRQSNPICRSAAVVIAAFAAVTPVSCSSSGSPPQTEARSIRIVIDGETRTVEGKIVCSDTPTGEVSIEVDPPDTAPGASVPVPIVVLDLTPQGDAPSVSLLAINLPDIGLSAGRYRTTGPPTAAKTGNTYTVKGQATVVGSPPGRPVYKPFELELTCP
jgi:hypothetical protein